MKVADASFLTDALVGGGPLGAAASDVLRGETRWHAPHHLPAEVLAALRGLHLADKVSPDVVADARRHLDTIRLRLHPVAGLARRIWELRTNATVYDAWYLALAEALEVPLVTSDRKLAQVPGIRCTVDVIEPCVA